jgi:hypothetical protein
MHVGIFKFNYEKKVSTVMVNNSINIKKNINSKQIITYHAGKPGPGLGQTHKSGGVKLVHEHCMHIT